MVMEIVSGIVGSLAGNLIQKKAENRPKSHVQRLIEGGSRTYEFQTTGIAAGAIEWFYVSVEFPEARTFEPLDSINIINNSASDITIFTNSRSEGQTIPSYMVKPIARKPFRSVGIRNDGAGAIAAGEVIIQMKRLPPNVQVVNIGGGA